MTNKAIHPVTPERWQDLEALFGPNRGCSGCWCMWFRLKRSDFERQGGEGNRLALKTLVEAGEVPGLLAYVGGQPAGWCSLAPRQAFPVLDRSPILKRVDDQPVWSVVCFYVSRAYRGQGLTASLLEAGVDYAHQNGAQIIEGYPVEPSRPRLAAAEGYHGLASTFLQAGFQEVLRRSPTRPIMRRSLK